MLTVLGGLAEFERELIKARTEEGRKRAGYVREAPQPIRKQLAKYGVRGNDDRTAVGARAQRGPNDWRPGLRALIEERIGSQTDWNAVDSLMLKALGAAEKVARYRHAQLSAVKIAGELKSGPADGATLDELLERIKGELTKLGPILELEVAREPER